MELLLIILSSVGFTFMVTQSYVFSPIRNYVKSKNRHLGKLFSCTMCFGYWSGAFSYAMYCAGLNFVLYAGAGSFLGYASYLLLRGFMDKFD